MKSSKNAVAPRFYVVSTNGVTMGLNTEHQVKTYVERTIRGDCVAFVYEKTAVAKCDAVRVTTLKKKCGAKVRCKNAPRACRKWSNVDIRQLFTMRKAGVPFAKIAHVLGRTKAAVHSKYHS